MSPLANAIARPSRWRWRWLAAGGSLLGLGLAAVLLLFRPLWYAPIELSLLSLEPVEITDDAGQPMLMAGIQVRNHDAAGIAFARADTRLEFRCQGQWVETKEPWPVTGLGPRDQPSGSEVAMILVPIGADACRVDLAYYFWHYPKLPLQIHDSWARRNAKSPTILRAQQVVRAISPPLFDWLWPKSPVQYTSRLQHRRQVYSLLPQPATESTAPN